MTAAALLAAAEAEGVSVRLAAPARLVLRGDWGAVARWTQLLRPRRTALLDLLTRRAADVAEAIAERATIPGFGGGLPRDEAQWVAELAGAFYMHHWSCPTCRYRTQTGGKLYRPCPVGAELWAAYCAAHKRLNLSKFNQCF